jgi:hypothetical protein
VVEHPLGKGEVVSSILTGSTTQAPPSLSFCDQALPCPPAARGEQSALSPNKLGENVGNLFASRSGSCPDDREGPIACKKIAAGRHEISVRYRWHAKQRRPGLAQRHPFNFIRLRELESIFKKRYGRILPNDDAGQEDFLLAANQIAQMPGDIVKNIFGWASRWAPWMSREQAQTLANSVASRPRRYSAIELGELLGLTDRERTELNIKTIRAVDVTEDELIERRKRYDRERKRRCRAKKRAGKPLPLSVRRPWKAQGLSRTTWYRRQKRHETKSVRSNIAIALDRICLTHQVIADEP